MPFDVTTDEVSVEVGRMRKRRPSVSWSDTKSSDQRSSGLCGTSIGALVPIARLRPPRRRTASFSPDRAGTASCGSRPGPPASASREDAGSRTGDAPARSPSSAREPRGRPACWSRSEPSCGDLPLNCHPAAIRASTVFVTPCGAG